MRKSAFIILLLTMLLLPAGTPKISTATGDSPQGEDNPIILSLGSRIPALALPIRGNIFTIVYDEASQEFYARVYNRYGALIRENKLDIGAVSLVPIWLRGETLYLLGYDAVYSSDLNKVENITILKFDYTHNTTVIGEIKSENITPDTFLNLTNTSISFIRYNISFDTQSADSGYSLEPKGLIDPIKRAYLPMAITKYKNHSLLIVGSGEEVIAWVYNGFVLEVRVKTTINIYGIVDENASNATLLYSIVYETSGTGGGYYYMVYPAGEEVINGTKCLKLYLIVYASGTLNLREFFITGDGTIILGETKSFIIPFYVDLEQPPPQVIIWGGQGSAGIVSSDANIFAGNFSNGYELIHITTVMNYTQSGDEVPLSAITYFDPELNTTYNRTLGLDVAVDGYNYTFTYGWILYGYVMDIDNDGYDELMGIFWDKNETDPTFYLKIIDGEDISSYKVDIVPKGVEFDVPLAWGIMETMFPYLFFVEHNDEWGFAYVDQFSQELVAVLDSGIVDRIPVKAPFKGYDKICFGLGDLDSNDAVDLVVGFKTSATEGFLAIYRDVLHSYAEQNIMGGEGDRASNVRETDTDGDNLTDYYELKIAMTNPYNPDTDQDELTDYEELFTYNTNPLNPDTDGDGINDYTEILYGLDPNEPNSSVNFGGSALQLLILFLGGFIGVPLLYMIFGRREMKNAS